MRREWIIYAMVGVALLAVTMIFGFFSDSSTPPDANPQRCKLDSSVAPTLRGLRLGMSAEEIKAKHSDLEIKCNGELWIGPSQSGRGTYTVAFHPEGPSCTCPDYAKHQVQCKHIHAVEYARRSQGLNAPDEEPPKHGRRRKTYPQNWTAYNLAQTREKFHLQELLYTLCQGVEEPIQTKGRPRLAAFVPRLFDREPEGGAGDSARTQAR
jgi:hypothetical protein